MQQLCRSWFARIKIAVIAMLIGVAGCRNPVPSAVQAQPRWPGMTIRVAAPPGPPTELINQLGREWANSSHAKLVTVPMTADWPDADVVLAPAADLPHWAAAGKVATLPRPEAVDAFMPVYRTRLLTWNGKVYGFPLLGDGPICVYRLDVFSDASMKSAYEAKFKKSLQPPQTWDEFADQAEFFAERRARPSLPPLPRDDTATCAALESIAAPMCCAAIRSTAVGEGIARSPQAFSFQYNVETGEPRIGEAGFVEALNLLQRIQKHRAKTNLVAEAMAGDQAVLGYITLADLAALGKDDAKRWGVFRIPGSHRVFGPNGSGGASGSQVNFLPFVGAGAVVGMVSAGSSQAEMAFDLLTYLTSPTVSTEIVHTPSLGSGPFREMHLDNQRELGWFNFGLTQPQTASLRTYLREIADPRADNPALVLRIPARQSHIEAWANEIRAALTGGDAAAAMRNAASRWRQLDGSPDKARTEFRRSVGLKS